MLRFAAKTLQIITLSLPLLNVPDNLPLYSLIHCLVPYPCLLKPDLTTKLGLLTSPFCLKALYSRIPASQPHLTSRNHICLLQNSLNHYLIHCTCPPATRPITELKLLNPLLLDLSSSKLVNLLRSPKALIL